MGGFFERVSPVWSARDELFGDCDCVFYSERKLLSIGSAWHVHIEEEESEVVCRDVFDGKESGDHFARTFLGARSVRKEWVKRVPTVLALG